jgi:hypothetical protein
VKVDGALMKAWSWTKPTNRPAAASSHLRDPFETLVDGRVGLGDQAERHARKIHLRLTFDRQRAHTPRECGDQLDLLVGEWPDLGGLGV